MKYGSVCSGIEAATVAWHPLGWTPAFFAEIERFPSEVLGHHYGSNLPGEPWSRNAPPNLGDMTKFQEWPDADLDVLVGGTPCQDYSVAGLRLGMAGDRGQLTLTYIEIAARYRPQWVAWENVPGVLSSNEGRDFARFLGDLSGQTVDVPKGGWRNAGIIPGIADAYGLAYRVLDAQYVRVDGFGRAVPQRRRRVFVVGYLGDWRCAAAVFFERESLSGHSAPSRKAGQRVADTVAGGARSRGGYSTDDIPLTAQTLAAARGAACAHAADLETYLPVAFGGGNRSGAIDAAACLTAKGQRIDFEVETFVAHSLRGEGFDASEDGTGRGTPIVPIAFNSREDPEVTFDRSGPLGASSPQAQAIAYGMPSKDEPNQGAPIPYDFFNITAPVNRQNRKPGDPCHTLARDNASHATIINEDPAGIGWAVRRLTPTECERLQGFPDGYTAISRNGKPSSDGPRYKALGNSMAVNVMRWIGRRIELVDGLVKELQKEPHHGR